MPSNSRLRVATALPDFLRPRATQALKMVARRELMDVSIVIPTRNRSGLLRTTIRSALRQQHVEFELIVVDEGSTDETTQVLAQVRHARLRVIRHQTPLGLSAARNHGAEEARGTWVAFLDDDNLWAPDKLIDNFAPHKSTARDWVYTGSVNSRARASSMSPHRRLQRRHSRHCRDTRSSQAGGRMSLSDDRCGTRWADSTPPSATVAKTGSCAFVWRRARPACVRGPPTDGQTDSFVQHVHRHCRDTAAIRPG